MSDPLFILGVDLGQAQDFTALCVLERSKVEGEKANHYAVRHLERLSKGTPYPAQVERIRDLRDRLKETTGKPPKVVADATGVGAPVIDMLRAARLEPVAVTITGGDKTTKDGDDFRVPKRDLVSAVQVLLQSERLKIARALPEAATLTSELLAFKVSVNLRGHASFGNDVGAWRENDHDDLVLSVALAAWYGEQHKPRASPTAAHHLLLARTFAGKRE